MLKVELLAIGHDCPVARLRPQGFLAAGYLGPRALNGLWEAASDGLPGAKAAARLAVGYGQVESSMDEILQSVRDEDIVRQGSWDNDIWGNSLWALGELAREHPEVVTPVMHDFIYAPDAYTRGLAWLGLAKAGTITSSEEIDQALGISTKFYERTLIAIAAGLMGHERYLFVGLTEMIANYCPPFRLLAHIKQDFVKAMRKNDNSGGSDLITLTEIGDLS